MLLATRHKRAQPALTPAGEGWYLIYLPRRDGRLSRHRCLITLGPGIEPMTARSEVRRPNGCANEVYNDRVLAAGNGDVTALCLLDLTAAFDTVDHDLLLLTHHMEHQFDLRTVILQWLSSID